MKNLFKSFVVGALLLGSVGCSDMFKEDLYEINNEIDKINQRIDSLCNAVNTNIASLQTIIDVMQDNDYVDSITPIVENGVTIGYEIVFTQSGSVKIYHGEKGETGATGHSPVVGVKQAEDGRWYWTIDGEWMVNAEGKKILAEAIDGEDGAPGADGIPGVDGITPKLKVQDNYWYISYDNGTTWERLGKATGEAGADGDSMFQSVNYNEDYVELVLVDGTVLTIPTWASHMLLVDEIAKINNNISAIQAAVKALESNDYVQKVTPVEDKEGNVIGYTLQFAFAGDVTIYHGEDGEKGEDGHTPVIGVKQFNGEWYWTIDGEWLVDGNGEMVPTSGEDGAEGAEGQTGITPELKIEDDYWYVSYDKGGSWTKLGKAKGEDGAAGGDGAAGDAFFEDVDTSDEYYIILTLADGTEIKIPTWKAHQALADAVAQLNTNVTSLQAIITGIQNNDFVTGTTEIVDPQTNEVIGYKLHFSKSGDIEIYHGKTPNAPEIGIRKHPQYGLCWTYDGEYIKDPSTGKPVALPKDGANAIAPKFMIENGMWYMSTDDGRTWQEIGQATGDQGETGATGGAGDSFFKSIEPEFATDANGNVLKDSYGKPIVAYIVMTLAGENEGEDVVYKVPTEYITSDINKRLAAIEAQFSTISTIVNALQNAEYIKEVVELYEGPALVGYEITFVKYAIGADGKLTETTRKSTIRNGGAGAAGTVVAAEYDEATDTWYWTLDGEPLKDADGNYVAINGKNGQAGVTPLMRINTDTNEWEVSYDNGKTYTTTGVKATGPQGPQGNPGQGGAAGDSFFADVYKDGDYWVFERVDGNKIMVPTAEAFASLAEKVAALDESSKAFASLINGKKFIESCEPFTNDSGSGYKLVLVSLNAETGETVKEDYFIFNGEDAETPVVGLRQDETTGDWYWTVDGEDILVDGKPVKANGPQGIDGPVPSFRIDPTNGHLYVTVNGTESDLGRVVGTNGSAGEAGSSSSIVVTPGEDGQLTIDFIGGDGLTSTIVVPSWEAFVALQEAVSALNTNVETISALVYGHKYVESFKELENGGYEFVVRYYDEAAKEWKTEVHAIDITTADEIGVKMDPEDENYYWTKGGEWLLDAAGNKVMVDGSAERTLEFKSENDGKLYYKYSDETEWTVLDIAVSESVVDSNVVVKEENGKVTVTVLDDAGLVLYTFSAPSWEAFEALQGRVIALEEQVTDIYTLIAQLTTNYEALSGDVKTMKDKLAKCKFIGEYEYDAERKGNVIYLVDIDGNKLQNAAGEYETIFIADGEDGEDFDASMLSFKEVDGDYFWTYNGEMLLDAEGNPVKAHGADGIDGRTPEFRIFNDVLQYRYEGEGDDAWQSLGNVKGSASAANITVENPADPDHSMWIMIQYTYTDAQGNEIVEEVKLPTYYAYEKALDEIAAIKSTIEMVETFLKGNKFVSDYELTYDNNGMVSGCTVTTVEYKLQEDGSYRVFTSEAEFNPSQTMSVKLENDVWYLVFYNEKGEEVKRPLSQSTFTFVPKVAVNNGYLYVAKVSEPGNDYTDTTKWDCLGAVVELLGGETGSAQGALKSVEEIDGYICFTFSNGDVLKVPSDAKFQEVLDRLDAVENTVAGLQPLLDGQTFITGITVKADGSGFDYTYKTVDSEGKVSGNQSGSVSLTGLVIPDGTKGFKVVTGYEDGEPVYTEMSWDHTPVFATHDGKVYMSIDPTAKVGEIASQLEAGKGGWIEVYSIPEDGNTNYYGKSEPITAKVGDTEVTVGYKIYFPDGNGGYLDPIEVVSKAGYDLLVERVDNLEGSVAGLQTLLSDLDFTYVTGITEKKDASGNVIGIDFTTKTVTDGTVADGPSGSVSLTGLVIPNGTKGFKVVTGYTDEGEPDYTEMSWDHTPVFATHGGKVYMSIDPTANVTEIASQLEAGKGGWIVVYSIPEDGNTNYYGKSEPITAKVDDTEVTVGYKIYFPDGNGGYLDPIEVVSKAGYDLLVGRVEALEGTVAGLQALLSDLDFTYVTGITEKKDASGNVIGIDFTTKTVTDGTVADGPSGSVSLTGLVIPNGTKGFKVVTGYTDKGEPDYTEMSWDHTPVFATHGGKVYMSIDPTANVTEIASQLEAGKGGWIEVYSIPEDLNTNYYGKSEPITETIDGVEVIVGYNIIFPDGNGGYLEAIKVVSMAGYEFLVERVTALEKNIETIDNVLSGMSFVKSIVPVYDNETNKNIIGFKGEIVTVTGSVAGNTASLGTPAPFTYTSTNYVVPVKEGDVWYWYANGTKLCAIDGTFVPEIVLDGGYIYVSKPGAGDFATDKEASDFADKWYKLDGNLTENTDTYGSYDDKGTYYEIKFPGSATSIQVPKYYQTPVITFGTDGTLDLGTASSATVTCTITGSFTSAPVIYTNCEGNFTSTASAVTGSGNTYTATITVRPTTAYAGDNMSGKLTVYCPYYGNTGIGQINLAATGSGELVLQSTSTEPMTILEKPANNATASITFRLEGEDAPPSSGLPVIIDNNYTLTDVQNVLTNDGTKDVETGNGFSASLDYAGTEGWITLGDCNYDAATKKFTQHFTLGDNTSTESPRTGAVVVFSPSRREVARFIIKQEPATPPTIIDATNLAVGQSANCYIISKPGRYELPAYKGVYKDLTTAPYCTGKPDEIWNDSGNTIRFLQANFSDNKIIFDVESVEAGNAIIGIRNPKNENDILWSWHLWFCPNGTPGTQTYPAGSDGKVYTLMDRNLGAKDDEVLDLLSSSLTYWTDGLFYQWGRKDPIRLDANGERANTEAAKNADVQFDPNWNASDSWTASKAVTDPCPPGYKVPSSSVWRDEPSSGAMELIAKNTLTAVYPYNVASDNVSSAILFPYVGFIDDGGVVSKGIKTDKVTDKTSSVPIYSPTSAGLAVTSKTPGAPSVTPKQFRNVQYRETDINVKSSCWSSDNSDNSLEYGYVSGSLEILAYEYRMGTWKETVLKLPSWLGGTTYTYTANWSDTWYTVTSEWDTENNKYNDKLSDYDRDEILQILELGQLFSSRTLIYDKTFQNVKYANQVRCVAE